MGMAILFRNSPANCPFREALLELSRLPGDEMIISTGFIYPRVLSDNTLVDAIRNGLASGGILRIVSGAFNNHNQDAPNCINYNLSGNLRAECNWCSHEASVDYFTQQLNPNADPAGITVQGINYFSQNRLKWHAKIALKIENNTIRAAILGSSNISNPSFTLNYQNFNCESDLYIWDRNYFKKVKRKSEFDQLTFEDIDNLGSFIKTLPVSLRGKGNTEQTLFTQLLNLFNNIR